MDYDYSKNLMPPEPRRRDRSYLVLLLMIIVVGLLGMLLSVANAQTSESTSTSVAVSDVDVDTVAGAAVIITDTGQAAGKSNKTYSEVATAPSLGGLALGGGHPCAYSPATAQISIIGGGAGLGGMKVDSACMLMVMGAAGDAKAYKASQLMIAARDPDACAAMEAAGLVTCGGTSTARASASAETQPSSFSKPTASSKSVAAVMRCELVGNTLKFKATSAAARNAELLACKARFGL